MFLMLAVFHNAYSGCRKLFLVLRLNFCHYDASIIPSQTDQPLTVAGVKCFTTTGIPQQILSNTCFSLWNGLPDSLRGLSFQANSCDTLFFNGLALPLPIEIMMTAVAATEVGVGVQHDLPSFINIEAGGPLQMCKYTAFIQEEAVTKQVQGQRGVNFV